jgi:hypothetical protein
MRLPPHTRLSAFFLLYLHIKHSGRTFLLAIEEFTANEGLVRIQYKCLFPIYVFPEMKLCRLLISKTGS